MTSVPAGSSWTDAASPVGAGSTLVRLRAANDCERARRRPTERACRRSPSGSRARRQGPRPGSQTSSTSPNAKVTWTDEEHPGHDLVERPTDPDPDRRPRTPTPTPADADCDPDTGPDADPDADAGPSATPTATPAATPRPPTPTPRPTAPPTPRRPHRAGQRHPRRQRRPQPLLRRPARRSPARIERRSRQPLRPPGPLRRRGGSAWTSPGPVPSDPTASGAPSVIPDRPRDPATHRANLQRAGRRAVPPPGAAFSISGSGSSDAAVRGGHVRRRVPAVRRAVRASVRLGGPGGPAVGSRVAARARDPRADSRCARLAAPRSSPDRGIGPRFRAEDGPLLSRTGAQRIWTPCRERSGPPGVVALSDTFARLGS